MTMSEHSLQIDWLATESEWMSSAEGSPARTSAPPERVLVLQARGADCGVNTIVSLAKFYPDTSSWRTSQRCLVEGLERYSETFPRSGMTRSGTAFPLPTLAPLTGETESGLWPTPTGMGGGGSSRSGNRINETPTLQGMARKGMLMWPTPKGSEAGPDFAKLERSSTGLSLQTAVALWPTPTVGDSRASGSRNTPHSKAHAGVSLTDAVRGDAGRERMQFATPLASDAKGGAPQDTKGKRSLRLDAKNWPTPAARDYRHPNALPYSERGGGTKGEQLPNAVGGSLNPEWVALLMGFPKQWVNLTGETDAKVTNPGRRKGMQGVPAADGAEALQRALGGQVDVSSPSLLRSDLHGSVLDEVYTPEIGSPVASQEVAEERMRSVRGDEADTGASHRSESSEQRPDEHSVPLQNVPRLLAFGSEAYEPSDRRTHASTMAWGPGWEDDVARISKGTPNRVSKLKALGNAVVPQIVEIIGRAILAL